MYTVLCEFQRVRWNATHSFRHSFSLLLTHSHAQREGITSNSTSFIPRSTATKGQKEKGDKRIARPKQPWSVCHSLVTWSKLSNVMSHRIRSLHFLFGCVMAPLLSCQYDCYLFITINIYVCIPAEYQHLQAQDRSEEVPWRLSPFWLKRNGALFRPNTIIITHGFRTCIFHAALLGVRGQRQKLKVRKWLQELRLQ